MEVEYTLGFVVVSVVLRDLIDQRCHHLVLFPEVFCLGKPLRYTGGVPFESHKRISLIPWNVKHTCVFQVSGSALGVGHDKVIEHFLGLGFVSSLSGSYHVLECFFVHFSLFELVKVILARVVVFHALERNLSIWSADGKSTGTGFVRYLIQKSSHLRCGRCDTLWRVFYCLPIKYVGHHETLILWELLEGILDVQVVTSAKHVFGLALRSHAPDCFFSSTSHLIENSLT